MQSLDCPVKLLPQFLDLLVVTRDPLQEGLDDLDFFEKVLVYSFGVGAALALDGQDGVVGGWVVEAGNMRISLGDQWVTVLSYDSLSIICIIR